MVPTSKVYIRTGLNTDCGSSLILLVPGKPRPRVEVAVSFFMFVGFSTCQIENAKQPPHQELEIVVSSLVPSFTRRGFLHQ